MRPPYSRMEKEARLLYGKSYEECSDNEKMMCEDLALEYCGISPEEIAREEYERKYGVIEDD